MGEYATTARTTKRVSSLRHARRLICAGMIAAATFAPAPTAVAQDLSVEDAQALLEGQSADEVRMGIEALGLRADAAAVAPIAERIRAGLPPALLDLAIETLSTMGRPEAGPILVRLLQHRRPEVRRSAAQALQQCRATDTADALVTALEDDDPRVRASVAQALGALGPRGLGRHREQVVDTLFAAYERGMLEAAPVLGQLVTGRSLDRLQGYLGRRPFDVLTPAFDEVFARDDIPNPRKIALIGALAELATGEVARYLENASLVFSGPVASAARRAAMEIGQ